MRAFLGFKQVSSELLSMKLFKAIKKEQLDKVKDLLQDKNLDINWRDDSGNTALILATREKDDSDVSLEIIRLLLEAGADPSITITSIIPIVHGISHKVRELLLPAICKHTIAKAQDKDNETFELIKSLITKLGDESYEKLALALAMHIIIKKFSELSDIVLVFEPNFILAMRDYLGNLKLSDNDDELFQMQVKEIINLFEDFSNKYSEIWKYDDDKLLLEVTQILDQIGLSNVYNSELKGKINLGSVHLIN